MKKQLIMLLILLYTLFSLTFCQSNDEVKTDESNSVENIIYNDLFDTEQSLQIELSLQTEQRLQATTMIQDLYNIPNDISHILKKDCIIFGFIENDRPPFYMSNEEGRLYGIDVQNAENIAYELGVKAVFDRSSASYSELYQKLINGDIDIIIAKFSRTLNVMYCDKILMME